MIPAVVAAACSERASLGGEQQPSPDGAASGPLHEVDGSAADANRGDGLAAGGDAAGGDAAGGASACVFMASSYDQSCSADSDCTTVISADYCGNKACPCGGSPISVVGKAQFNADIANTPLGSGALQWPFCSCELSPPLCCRAGMCTNDCNSLPACTAAGGTCKGVVNCPHGVGPVDSCATANLTCCLN